MTPTDSEADDKSENIDDQNDDTRVRSVIWVLRWRLTSDRATYLPNRSRNSLLALSLTYPLHVVV